MPKLSNGKVGRWLGFTVAITFLQGLADATYRDSDPWESAAKKGLLHSLMKIAGLQEDDL